MTRKQIQKHIRELGLTQTEVARLVGITPQKLTNRLRGDVKAKEHSPKIADILGLKVSDLPKPKSNKA